MQLVQVLHVFAMWKLLGLCDFCVSCAYSTEFFFFNWTFIAHSILLMYLQLYCDKITVSQYFPYSSTENAVQQQLTVVSSPSETQKWCFLPSDRQIWGNIPWRCTLRVFHTQKMDLGKLRGQILSISHSFFFNTTMTCCSTMHRNESAVKL